jgi:hypothetical protein
VDGKILHRPAMPAREVSMARYGKAASSSVARTMRRRKRGKLTSGRSGKKVTSRKQAIAIGLSEARKKGAKVPSKRRGRARTRRRSASRARRAA